MILWAIKSPDGAIDHLTARRKRSEAISSYIGELLYWTWRDSYRKGYRAVKVELREIV